MSGCYKRVNFYDLCRLCAQNIQKNKVKIFEQEGEKIQLQFKIKKCLSLNVNEDDFLPKVVCSKCIRMLEICNAFREECLNSETMLSTYFKNSRHTEDFKKSGKVYIKDNAKPEQLSDISQSYENEPGPMPKIHKTKQSSIPRPVTSVTQKPEICSKTFVASNTMPTQVVTNRQVGKQDQQLSSNTISQIQTMQLPYNLDAVTINEALKKAVQQLPKELLNKVIVNAYGEVINFSPPDPLCLESLNLPSNAVSGITSVIKNKMTKAEDSVKEKKALEQNVIKIDLTDEDNQQDVHPAKFNAVISFNKQSNGQPLVQNPTVIFPVSQYQNNQFSSVPTNNMSYPQQTTVNLPPTPTVINVICNNPSETSHINPHSQSPPSSINMDDLRSSTYVSSISQTQPKVGMTSQENTPKKPLIKSDDPQKTHACEVCSKTFKRREHLYQHIKLHTGFRPFRCIECNKAFVRKEHLIRHKVLHSGVRNYSCDICAKSFSRHDNLLKHIRTHNKEPAYTCEVCQKVFIIKHYYNAHRNEQGKCYLSPQLRVC